MQPVVVSGPAAFNLARRRAVLTGVLVAANLVLFVVSAATQRSAWSGLGDIMENGALWGPAVDVGGEWWRLFTSGFLHANILHVGFNALLLGLLGATLERRLGVVRFAVLYLAALLAGSLGALLASPRALTIGASGAVFGLMGAHLMASRAGGRRARDSGVMGLLVLNLVTTFLIPNISIGGPHRRPRRRPAGQLGSCWRPIAAAGFRPGWPRWRGSASPGCSSSPACWRPPPGSTRSSEDWASDGWAGAR